jgi:predicted nucleotidyltransferase
MAELIISELRKKIEPIAVKFRLKLAVLFGSGARDRMRHDSDIDIGVAVDLPVFEKPQLYRNFMEAFEPIENYYKKKTDLVLIRSDNILILSRILKEGVLLYEYKPFYYNLQRLHWRFLVEDNYRYTLNYSRVLEKKLDKL